jgi:excisionase family DNA binding protein
MSGKKPTPEIMSVEQLRIYLKIDWKAAKELLENGTIPGRMIRGRWRCHKQAVDNWLMGNSTQSY